MATKEMIGEKKPALNKAGNMLIINYMAVSV